MELREFKIAIQKDKRVPKKVKNSYGVYDCYKAIRKNNWFNIGRPLKEHEFYTIIRSVNKMLAEEISNGNTVVFPANMGCLELRKTEVGVSVVNGKLKNTYPINWNETLKLWYEDEEARKNKTLLRDEEKFIYHVKYCKGKANYENKQFYQFDLNTFIKKGLKENIKKGKIDTIYGN